MVTKPINVLLVEDNPSDVLLVRATLAAAAGAKFEVTTADYLETAIHRANSEHFDVMLLDLGLPDAQGLETFQRAHSRTSEIPIIVLSGLGDDEIAMRAVQQGAQDYLPKAGVLDDLLPRAIRYAIERNRSQLALEYYAAELREKNRQLLEELNMAREIQQALLPHHYPQFAAHQCALRFAHCYRPAVGLSGDFFSVLRLSENQAGVLICDVMGHGVRAALIGTLARGLVDQFMPIASNPGEFLASLNRELAEILKKGAINAFATAFYYVVDLAEQRITYANAGHPHAMILRRNDGHVEWLRVNGHRKPPLGIFVNTEYPSFQSTLATHDSILLFTDGLFEAENSKGEQFGRQRLIEAVSQRLEVPCEFLLDELVQETQEFSGREDFSDDVCLVGMDVVTAAAMHEHAA
jgi:serine phosphatase RsbU (regulator of sigma subunit)